MLAKFWGNILPHKANPLWLKEMTSWTGHPRNGICSCFSHREYVLKWSKLQRHTLLSHHFYHDWGILKSSTLLTDQSDHLFFSWWLLVHLMVPMKFLWQQKVNNQKYIENNSSLHSSSYSIAFRAIFLFQKMQNNCWI